MKVDVTQQLKTFSGQAMKDKNENGEAIDATLRLALVNAVLAPTQKEQGVDKVKKYELARRIYKEDVVELSAEEITLLKKAVGEAFSLPLIVGQVMELLEGKSEG